MKKIALFVLMVELLFLSLLSVSYRSNKNDFPKEKTKPSYTGVDPAMRKYVNEYIELAHQHNINFTKTVTVGFTHLHNNIIGLTTYQPTFREIDVDRVFWIISSNLSRKMLLFHELTHAYCTRGHDWGFGIPYTYQSMGWYIKDGRMLLAPGYYSDGCPLSIMNPLLVNNTCAKRHYSDYINEMFQRCIPY